MVFNLEISIPIMNVTSELEKYIMDIAFNHHSISHYSFSEMENNNFQKRNHMIYVFLFLNNDFKNLENFIKHIRKIKYISIECLYEDNITCKLIYASSYYLSNIDKEKVKLYQKRKRSYSEDENLLIREIKCKT